MPMILLLGGARSGKSALAVSLMSTCGDDVVMLATGEGGDEEMRRRIEMHRTTRPPGWTIVEEPIEIERAIAGVGSSRCLLVDCLTLWVSNLIGRGLADDDIEGLSLRAAAAGAAREGPTIVVSNEVGSGIVPDNALARRYRDLLGRVNAQWGHVSDNVYLTVAGGVVPVLEPDVIWDRLNHV